MNLFNGKLGAEGTVTADLVGGVVKVIGSENTPGAVVKLEADVNLIYFADQGAQKLNSPLASAVISVLETVLKSIP